MINYAVGQGVGATLLRPLGRLAALALVTLLSACGDGAAEASSAPAAATSAASLAARDRWAEDVGALRSSLATLGGTLDSLAADSTARADSLTLSVQRQFAESRRIFKRAEYLSAYYQPSTTKSMNGPALPRVDDEEGPEAVFPPEGFQVIEELLFPAIDRATLSELRDEVRNLEQLTTRLATAASRQSVSDDRVWDAAKLEIARIVTLGITGFDSPIAQHSLVEAGAALEGIRDGVAGYREQLGAAERTTLDSLFTLGFAKLSQAPSFNDFDRLGFIIEVANPLARAMSRSRESLGIGIPEELRAFQMQAYTLFDEGAFEPLAFAPLRGDSVTPERIALGHALFFEPRLSGDGSRACSTCHLPNLGFTDGRARAMTRGSEAKLRNTPTVINVGLQVGSFYDLRTTYLEDQVTDVVGNVDEMHGSLAAVAATLSQDAQYKPRIAAAYPANAGAPLGEAQLRGAIAMYLRSLVALNSPVDRALRGDRTALDAEERLGLNLFLGKAKCATCHFAPLFNGTVPPMYQESEVEVLGTPATPVWRNARVDADSGRARLTRAVPHLFAFKTPSVRNVAITAPYMHNGVYRTLEEVVDFYNRGGGAGIGISLDNQTLPPDSLGLSKSEQRALVKMLRALTDTVGMTALPKPPQNR